MVEFALLLPVFLLITLGVVDFARVFTFNLAMINAVREGALAPTNATDTPTLWMERVENRVRGETDAAGMDWSLVTISAPECTTAATPIAPWTSCVPASDPKFMRVSASYQFDFLTPLLGNLFGSSMAASAVTTAPVINVPEAAPTPTPLPTPTAAPTATPTSAPTVSPTVAPSGSPTAVPSASPTASPTAAPTATPTTAPTASPTAPPTATPTVAPTASPTPPSPGCTPDPDKLKICPTPGVPSSP